MSIAYLFPGQGSQYVGMGRALAAVSAAAREVFRQADEALGRPLSKLIFEGPEDALRLTENTQPAILTASVACLRALEEAGAAPPAAAAGHSLGEYSALVAAGVLALPDAVRLVEKRGRFMQEAVPVGQGTMAAILGLDLGEVEQICRRLHRPDHVVEVANDNCPGQVVISGHTAAVAEACKAAKQAGAKRAVELAVSAPFHCSLMEPAGRRLEVELRRVEVAAPRFPVVANVDAQPYRSADDVVPRLVAQVSNRVRWQECVKALRALGVDRFVEVGPGKVLSGLVRRIDRGAAVANVEDPETLRAALG
ncbi:ACP S-malonyltransferase [Deferrisoma sp.]